MNKEEKLEAEIKKLTEKYNCRIFYISIIDEDDLTKYSFAGNMCFVCAKDALEIHIEMNNIKHDSEETKVH